MPDRPDASELAAAIADFLRVEILPEVDDSRLRFRLRVAINGLSMLQREATMGADLLHRECALLGSILQIDVPSTATPAVARALNASLARRLRDDQAAANLAVLAELVTLKLLIVNPAATHRYSPETQ